MTFVENTYQTKSYSDIHYGQKRSNEIQEITVLNVQLSKKGKSSESSKTKTPFTGECRYCYGKGHKKEQCRVRECDRENKVWRSCTRTNPFTKEKSTDGNPVTWKKGLQGEIVVSCVQKVEDKTPI